MRAASLAAGGSFAPRGGTGRFPAPQPALQWLRAARRHQAVTSRPGPPLQWLRAARRYEGPRAQPRRQQLARREEVRGGPSRPSPPCVLRAARGTGGTPAPQPAVAVASRRGRRGVVPPHARPGAVLCLGLGLGSGSGLGLGRRLPARQAQGRSPTPSAASPPVRRCASATRPAWPPRPTAAGSVWVRIRRGPWPVPFVSCQRTSPPAGDSVGEQVRGMELGDRARWGLWRW